jgi:hypothetical protein
VLAVYSVRTSAQGSLTALRRASYSLSRFMLRMSTQLQAADTAVAWEVATRQYLGDLEDCFESVPAESYRHSLQPKTHSAALHACCSNGCSCEVARP